MKCLFYLRDFALMFCCVAIFRRKGRYRPQQATHFYRLTPSSGCSYFSLSKWSFLTEKEHILAFINKFGNKMDQIISDFLPFWKQQQNSQNTGKSFLKIWICKWTFAKGSSHLERNKNGKHRFRRTLFRRWNSKLTGWSVGLYFIFGLTISRLA